MNKPLYLSHFTPSMMQADLLERLFVQREDTLQRTIGRIADSILKKTKHHDLFVGPRGIGKTHFISLLHHRLAQREDLTKRSLIAWMREEEWGVTSFAELLLRILRTLDESYPALGLAKEIAKLYDLKPKEVESAAEALLLKTLGTKALVLLIENLDDLFAQLKDAGQKAWRAFMQNHPVCTIVATTPALFGGVQLQKSPFFGFFRTERLEKFGFEDAVSLLKKIALERGDESLARVIDSPHGRARLRAVDHLAEGNPRIYIIFAQFLTEQTLDTLVDAFMHTLDELTPYYQSRMKELPGQQRKIVEYLCSYRGAAPVKEIAKGCFASQQTCSSQLGELREKGYVKSTVSGRESYYSLAEPMMRICLEVKKQRGEPIGIFVQILRIWYTQPELADWLGRLGDGQEIDRAYIAKALELAAQDREDPKVKPIEIAFEHALKQGQYGRCHELLEEWAAIEPAPGLEQQLARWNVGIKERDYKAAEAAANLIYQENKALGLAPLLTAIFVQAEFERVLEVAGTEPDLSLPGGLQELAYAIRGRSFRYLDRIEEAIGDLEKAAAILKDDVQVLSSLMDCYVRLRNAKAAAGIGKRLVKLQPSEPKWAMSACVYLRAAGKTDAAAKLMQWLVTSAADSAFTRLLKVFAGQNDIDFVTHAPDIEFAKNNDGFCGVVAELAVSAGKYKRELLEQALLTVTHEENLSIQAQTTVIILAAYLLNSDGEFSVERLLNKIAVAGKKHEANLGAAILFSVPFGKYHGATESQLASWKDKLERAFSDYLPSSGVAMSLRLLGAYLEWKRTNDERVLMRLPDEEQKLVHKIDVDNVTASLAWLPSSPMIDALTTVHSAERDLELRSV